MQGVVEAITIDVRRIARWRQCISTMLPSVCVLYRNELLCESMRDNN